MLSRGKLLIKIALGRQDCRTFATKKSPSLYALLNYLDNEAKQIDDSVKPTASLGMGASRFYELGIHCSKYACIGGMAPASFDQWEHRERPTGLSGMQDYRELRVKIMPCPELMAQKILNIFPMVEIKKRHLKVIQLYSRKDDKNFADHQCLNAANKITQVLLENGAFSLYSGNIEVRKPLSFHLDNSDFQLSNSEMKGLHAIFTKLHGCIQIEHLNINDIGVIYTDDQRDIHTLKKHIKHDILIDIVRQISKKLKKSDYQP